VLRIAAVSDDENNRLLLARAFDLAPPSWSVTLHHDVPPDADVVVCGPDRHVDGSVTFDPSRPDKLIADIAARAVTSPGRCILVVGATGGCGATSVAVHLAGASKACLIEATDGDVRRRLSMESARSFTIDRDGEPVELSALPVAPGFRVLLRPSAAPVEDVRGVVEKSAAVFDHVVIDAPEPCVGELAGSGAIGVLVLPPSRPGALRAKTILDRHPTTRWAIVTNRLGPGGALRRRALEELLERRIAVELPCSATLRDAEDDGRLLTSSMSPWLWQIKRLWRALATA